ncbi:UNVERIFIED_CONTAM: hypothetical protein GTU68_037600, partial [Idotea baltica]|nr:hypothetical protein [Idotea baltica]
MANRHGLIAGATGTGKTVTLQVLAESFSKLGVPVFSADVKGDLAGVGKEGSEHPKITERLEKIGLSDFNFEKAPTVIWDILQKNGIPIRTTISEVGPYLLANMLDCNDTQAGIIHIAFKFADDEGLLLLDLKDLKQLLIWISDNKKEISKEYGNVTSQSIAAIQRRLLVLDEAGGDLFFGETALNIKHLMQKDSSGKGVINLLDARMLMRNPRIYASFLLWLLSELFEELPEVGDSDLPKLVFFFDEAHLLFQNADSSLLQKIEQVVRLIRSKGVGIFFVTQHPQDIPDSVLSQLGNRVQHALRAFTPKEQSAVKVAARSFRANKNFKTEEEIMNLGVGEALVSVLDNEGVPTIVEKTLISPPRSKIGAITDEERVALYSNHLLNDFYGKSLDRESAYEVLK